MKDWKTWFEKAEENLRAGKAAFVARESLKISLADVPRQQAVRLANILRRSDQVSRGLRVLAPIVRPGKSRVKVSEATDAEKAEYAVLLHLAGSNAEAALLLRTLDAKRIRERDLYLAFTYFASWDYRLALPHLKTFCESAPSLYATCVGLVNLAAAHIACGDIIEAQAVLARVFRITDANQFDRLKANAFELLAQVHIQQRDYSGALRVIEKSMSVLAQQNSRDELYARKWQAIAQALLDKDVTLIKSFRAEAERRSDWENVRDADAYGLKIEFDQSVFDRLLFGTPNATFREKLLLDFPNAEVKAECEFGPPSDFAFDPEKGAISTRGIVFQGKIHEVFNALARDFYRPLSVAALFSELYPGEHYDVFSSRDRVHQLLRRGRREAEAIGLNVEIQEMNGGYKLKSLARTIYRVERKPARLTDLRLAQLIEQGLTKDLAAKDIQQSLNLTPAEFRSFISSAQSEGKIFAIGVRAATRYNLIRALEVRSLARAS